jgi:predicted Zn-dependent peptidase
VTSGPSRLPPAVVVVATVVAEAAPVVAVAATVEAVVVADVTPSNVERDPSPAPAGGGSSSSSPRAVLAGELAAPPPGSSVTGPEPGIELTTLPSGLRVATEQVPGSRSVSIGFWAGIGSRDESGTLAGASHFLEHLLFKGTADRSARDIAVAVDAVGGEMNAFTSREHTGYYTRLPARELAFGLDLLVDVVGAPAFREPEVDAEREVILEEILMNEDTPDDVVHTRMMEALFPDHGLGSETLGSVESITGMAREAIARFHREWYRPTNLVVAAAGDLTHREVVDHVAACLADVDAGAKPQRSAPADQLTPFTFARRPTEQAHVSMAWRGLHHTDPDRYALMVANQVLGGGMSSRLFQEVREERGLAYTVFSSPSSYSDAGAFTLYAGTAPARLGELLEVIDSVIDRILTDGITADEHQVARGYLEGATLLGLEDSGSRMARLGSSLTSRGVIIAIDENLERMRAVTRDDVARVLHRVLAAPSVLSVVGPFDEDDPRLLASLARAEARAA